MWATYQSMLCTETVYDASVMQCKMNKIKQSNNILVRLPEDLDVE